VRDYGNKKTYALKELTNINSISKQRFEREVQILSELNHPNIVKIFQWNMAGEPPSFSPYYIMEFLSGGSLRKYIDEKFSTTRSKNNEGGYEDLNLFDKRWTFRTIILPICNALSQAHSSNVFHRDLKPENILFTDATRSEIKIADWGLVKGQDYNTNNINHNGKKSNYDNLDDNPDDDNNDNSDSDMKTGLRLPQTEHRATKQNIIRLATEAENAGIDSLWVLERLIWPIKPQTHYPGSADGPS
jgi:serine/threonine protein kinase